MTSILDSRTKLVSTQNLPDFVAALTNNSSIKSTKSDLIWHAIRGAVNPNKFISNLAETLRLSEAETERLLSENGFGDIVSQKILASVKIQSLDPNNVPYQISARLNENDSSNLFSLKFSPSLSTTLHLTPTQIAATTNLVHNLTHTTMTDSFLKLYRQDIMTYHSDFMTHDAILIDQFIHDNFNTFPKYLLNSGIGGNEMSNHMIARLNNLDPQRKLDWFDISAPKQLNELPSDASPENTLFIEFSRSGKTEETVKTHEFTTRKLRRIVYANSGPLYELGKRDHNLVLPFPDEVSGRYGRNKTPLLLAPMYIAGFDTSKYWQLIELTIQTFDLSSANSLPVQLAHFIYVHQLIRRTNQIYLGTLTEPLLDSAGEFMQFWDEGVNKDGNDLMLCHYLGLPRDSHTILEGILGNYQTKLAIMLLRDDLDQLPLPPLSTRKIDAVNPAHAYLKFGQDEMIMAQANQARLEEVMPVVTITTHGSLSYSHALVLGQLWADTTFCYAKLKGIDPGSNPEVKLVRDRSAIMLVNK